MTQELAERLPQPREGVTGADRSADLWLSLEEEAIAVRQKLIGVVRSLLTATLVGNPAPVVAEMYKRMTSPQVGDLVVESTRAIYNRDYQGFGILVALRREWSCTDEEWSAAVAEERLPGGEEHASEYASDRPAEMAGYIQYGQAAIDVCRWTNAEFRMIPVR